MNPNISLAIEEACKIRTKFNPGDLSPFPYENIEKELKDVKIFIAPLLENTQNISGFINYDTETEMFSILVNSNKPKTRQHFTLAHELGHYFLHRDIIKNEEILIDGEGTLDGVRALFRLDTPESTNLEIEANNFAAELIMPTDLVMKAWDKLKNIEECANVFNVSVAAMAIRIEKLHLIKNE